MGDPYLQDFYDSFGLDEFQRIAVNEITLRLRELEGDGPFQPPAPDSERERLYIELGKIVGLNVIGGHA